MCVCSTDVSSSLNHLVYRLNFTVKKEGFGGGGSRGIKFIKGSVGNFAVAKPSGKTLLVTIGEGLPSNTRKCEQAAVFIHMEQSDVLCVWT